MVLRSRNVWSSHKVLSYVRGNVRGSSVITSVIRVNVFKAARCCVDALDAREPPSAASDFKSLIAHPREDRGTAT